MGKLPSSIVCVRSVFFAFALLFVAISSEARAGVISGFTFENGTGGFESSAVNVFPSVVGITTTLTKPTAFGEWNVTISAGSASSHTFFVSITNQNTKSLAIGAVTFQLTDASGNVVLGTGSPEVVDQQVQLVPIGGGPPEISSATPTMLVYANGELSHGSAANYFFQLTHGSATSGNFKFRISTVPEPTSLVMGSIALVTAGAGGWWRSRRKRAGEASAASAG